MSCLRGTKRGWCLKGRRSLGIAVVSLSSDRDALELNLSARDIMATLAEAPSQSIPVQSGKRMPALDGLRACFPSG